MLLHIRRLHTHIAGSEQMKTCFTYLIQNNPARATSGMANSIILQSSRCRDRWHRRTAPNEQQQSSAPTFPKEKPLPKVILAGCSPLMILPRENVSSRKGAKNGQNPSSFTLYSVCSGCSALHTTRAQKRLRHLLCRFARAEVLCWRLSSF